MKIFISGGCKNGKSYFAQRLAKTQQSLTCLNKASLYYIATMKPVDLEDKRRIRTHRNDREGLGFTTIEQSVDIDEILDKCDHNNSFLLDSLTALLANEMFPLEGNVNEQAVKKITNALQRITNNINNIVMVSDCIFSDAFLYDPLTEKYRKSLAEIDSAAADYCDVVLEAAYTNIIVHKGKETFGALYEKIP
jgi:adenosylcobinamide kinase/adenosylcobinamide-phosphate guanylyltransferase